jgi:hypothetical protein
MTSAKRIVGSIAIALTLMVSGPARAQTCTSDGDCPKGLSCQADPVVSPPVAICYDGDGGGACTPVTTTSTPVATSSCRAASCASAADCGEDMVCNSQTSSVCTGGTPVAVKCDPSTGCDPTTTPAPVPATCTDTTVSSCAYTWEMPCNLDSDCGANFTCQPTTYGMCSGSAGSGGTSTGTATSGGSGVATPGTTGSGSAGSTGTSSGSGGGSGTSGAPAPAPAPMPAAIDGGVPEPGTCTTVTSYPGYCAAKVIACTTDSDCPSSWTCAMANTGTVVATAPGTTGSAPVGVDAGAATPAPAPAPSTTGSCTPPTSNGTRYYGPGTGVDVGTTASVPKSTADAGEATGSTTPPTPTTAGGNGATGSTQTAASTGGGGGCNLGGGHGAPGGTLLLLAMAALAVARRRKP